MPLEVVNYEEASMQARKGLRDLCGHRQALTQEITPTTMRSDLDVGSSQRKKKGEEDLFSSTLKVTLGRITKNRRSYHSECPSLRVVDSASSWDTIPRTQDGLCPTAFLCPDWGDFWQVKNTNGISPMWLIHHIFRESLSLISRHLLCISHPEEMY